MTKIKCIFLVTSLDAGGAETYLLRFLKFAGNSIEAIVITKSGKKGALLEAYQGSSSRIYTIKSSYLSFGAWLELYRIIRKEDPDTVCDFTGNFAGIPLFLAKLIGVKNRIACYRRSSNAFAETKLNLFYNAVMNKLVLRSATHILANSKAGIKFFFNEVDSRMQVIRNGIDLTSFKSSATKQELRSLYNISNDRFIIGHTGRLNKAKNHTTLLEVAALLKKRNLNVQLVMCGKDTEQLKHNLPEPLIDSDVVILGYQTDIPSVLSTFDFYLFPSITEGMPNALMEAMALGLPFAASNIDSILEIVPEKFHSFLFPPTSTHEFAICIEKLVNNESTFSSEELLGYTRSAFDAHTNFQLFYQTIIGNTNFSATQNKSIN